MLRKPIGSEDHLPGMRAEPIKAARMIAKQFDNLKLGTHQGPITEVLGSPRALHRVTTTRKTVAATISDGCLRQYMICGDHRLQFRY